MVMETPADLFGKEGKREKGPPPAFTDAKKASFNPKSEPYDYPESPTPTAPPVPWVRPEIKKCRGDGPWKGISVQDYFNIRASAYRAKGKGTWDGADLIASALRISSWTASSGELVEWWNREVYPRLWINFRSVFRGFTDVVESKEGGIGIIRGRTEDGHRFKVYGDNPGILKFHFPRENPTTPKASTTCGGASPLPKATPPPIPPAAIKDKAIWFTASDFPVLREGLERFLSSPSLLESRDKHFQSMRTEAERIFEKLKKEEKLTSDEFTFSLQFLPLENAKAVVESIDTLPLEAKRKIIDFLPASLTMATGANRETAKKNESIIIRSIEKIESGKQLTKEIDTRNLFKNIKHSRLPIPVKHKRAVHAAYNAIIDKSSPLNPSGDKREIQNLDGNLEEMKEKLKKGIHFTLPVTYIYRPDIGKVRMEPSPCFLYGHELAKYYYPGQVKVGGTSVERAIKAFEDASIPKHYQFNPFNLTFGERLPIYYFQYLEDYNLYLLAASPVLSTMFPKEIKKVPPSIMKTIEDAVRNILKRKSGKDTVIVSQVSLGVALNLFDHNLPFQGIETYNGNPHYITLESMEDREWFKSSRSISLVKKIERNIAMVTVAFEAMKEIGMVKEYWIGKKVIKNFKYLTFYWINNPKPYLTLLGYGPRSS